MNSYWTEFLPRISSLNLILELDLGQQLRTLKLSRSDQLVIVLTNGEEVVIKLAYKLKNIEYKLLSSDITEKGTTVIALKFTTETLPNVEEKFNLLMTDSVTWSRSDFTLSSPYTLKCSKCGDILINEELVKSLHDLPSDSWAEMMDFWHCHKPTSDVKDKFQLKFNELRPSERSIIIGTYHLLFNKGDFGLGTECRCGATLGVQHRNNTLRIFKWNFLLNEKRYNPYYHAYNVIMDNINLNASRFYRLVDEETETKVLIIWVFNFGLSITSNHTDGVYENCLKVMYYEGDDDTFDKVELPRIVLDGLVHQLDKINEMIPTNFKKMQQWNVSYLYI